MEGPKRNNKWWVESRGLFQQNAQWKQKRRKAGNLGLGTEYDGGYEGRGKVEKGGEVLDGLAEHREQTSSD